MPQILMADQVMVMVCHPKVCHPKVCHHKGAGLVLYHYCLGAKQDDEHSQHRYRARCHTFAFVATCW